MENTLENKAKFFALYYGQDIVSDGKQRFGYSVKDYFDSLLDEEKAYLTLKPLNSISDEDAIKCGYPDAGDIKASYDLEDDLPHSLADELRSLGYALLFKGVSVEQQIKWDWVKLVK